MLFSIVGWQGSIEEQVLTLIASSPCMDTMADIKPIRCYIHMPTSPKQTTYRIITGEAGKKVLQPQIKVLDKQSILQLSVNS